ncbi:hypothetical protein [Pseudobutyrivibrio xylanivorans]|uniref:Uncharacterized protein n=1 Tax=Pseudobutyrivibrio xylanivorans DSM 14809 TaxID=1123012 RepID=A0A1M6IDY9_PSEXY|nr:hypothetical protein [Pseudobutyrivibrio xylanivorans]SHJ32664.1 hypothetical protein SAMN02745725_02283 [Pseudobutyrivibrio xylanivorans DSM 14809]
MDANILNSVSSNVSTTYTKPVEAKDSAKDTQETAKTEEKSGKFSEEAAVYEKSSDDTAVKSEKYSKADRTALVQQLKADQEKMMNNLLEIVQKTIAGQGSTFAIASQDDMWKFLAEGKFTADPDTIAKAKEDISEDGYWGVEKTSDRILEFAKALSGDDPDKADELLAAFKKGYEQATGTWGKDLPDISSKTYDAVLKKFDDWKNGGKKDEPVEAAENAAKTEG